MSVDPIAVPRPPYARPALAVLGSIHGLTLQQDKRLGASDGFTFMGQPITNAS